MMPATMDVPMAKRWIERYLRDVLAISREPLQRVVEEPFEGWGIGTHFNQDTGSRCLVGVVTGSTTPNCSSFRDGWLLDSCEAAYEAWDWFASHDFPAAVTWVRMKAFALLAEGA